MELRPITKPKVKFGEQLRYDWCAVGWWQKLIIVVWFFWSVYATIKILFLGC